VSQNDYQFDDLIKLQEIIRAVAETNLAVYYACSTADYKADGSIVTEADLAMQTGLTHALHELYPKIRMLGEEITEQQQIEVMQSGQDYWCLDPVDGTTNFHATVPLFSVSLGLVSDGQIVMAVIYDPNRDEFFSAIKGKGMWINEARVERLEQPVELGRSIAFVDFKRLNENLATSLVQDSPYKSQRNIGTCALEWAWLAAGRANLIIHGREKLWDYAAGVLLTEEAGGRCETFDAEPIFNQSMQPRSVIAASTPQLFELWASRIRSVSHT
jgi:myo-inositol-1(or 4)-monophosphatase